MAGAERVVVTEMTGSPVEGSQLYGIGARLSELQEKGEAHVAGMLEHNTPDRTPVQSIYALIAPKKANYEPTPDSLNSFMDTVVAGMKPNGDRSIYADYHTPGSFDGPEKQDLKMPRAFYKDELGTITSTTTRVMKESEPGILTSIGVKAAPDSVKETPLEREITIFVFPTAGLAKLAKEIIAASEQPDHDIRNILKEWGTALTPENREILARGPEGEQRIIEGVKTAIEASRISWEGLIAESKTRT